MFTKDDLIAKYPEFAEGSKVRSRDDENLGQVISIYDDYFVIEKGLFFPRDFSVRYDDVVDFRDGTLYLNLSRDDLQEWRQEEYAGWSQTEDVNAGRAEAKLKPEYEDRYRQTAQTEAVRVPVAEEKLEAQKKVTEREGAVVRKIVHTEYRHFSVPVLKEEVRVERVPVREGEKVASGESFKEGTVSVPVREEEVEVTKRPIVKEEVRVSKEQHIEEREVGGLTRKEEVKVEADKKKKTA